MTTHVLRIPLRVVFYREGGDWIAHCLEFDLLGDGSTIEKALKCLDDAIVTQIDVSLKHDNVANLFSPADGKFLRMFSAGKDIAALGQIEIKFHNVVIENTAYRKYQDDDLVPA